MKRLVHFLIPRFCLALLLIALVGCGLSDYERRMDEQRKRIAEFDETNALLDDPIEMPTNQLPTDKAERPAWNFDVFLRLPKGYGSAPKERVPTYSPYFPFYRYANTEGGYNIFVCAATVLDPKVKEKDYDAFTAKNFRIFVQQAFDDFYFKTYKTKLFLPAPDKMKAEMIGVKPVTAWSGEVERVTYAVVAYNDVSNKTIKDHSSFIAYFHEEASRQVCIMVQRPVDLPADSAFDKSVEAMLGTLDISSEAASRRAQFLARRR